MGERETVKVGCKIPNGLRLHVTRRTNEAHAAAPVEPILKDMGFIDLGGHQLATPKAPGVKAKTETFTEVDKELFDLWMAENAEGSLVKSGMVFVQEPAKDESRKEPPEARDEHAGDAGEIYRGKLEMDPPEEDEGRVRGDVMAQEMRVNENDRPLDVVAKKRGQ